VYELSEWRFLTDTDIADAKRVVVLGYDLLTRALFPYQEPIGEKVRVGDEWFTVVGTLVVRERSNGAVKPTPSRTTPCATVTRVFLLFNLFHLEAKCSISQVES
jgi:hypothetical protein